MLVAKLVRDLGNGFVSLPHFSRDSISISCTHLNRLQTSRPPASFSYSAHLRDVIVQIRRGLVLQWTTVRGGPAEESTQLLPGVELESPALSSPIQVEASEAGQREPTAGAEGLVHLLQHAIQHSAAVASSVCIRSESRRTNSFFSMRSAMGFLSLSAPTVVGCT
jgi:hypothetical protein